MSLNGKEKTGYPGDTQSAFNPPIASGVLLVGVSEGIKVIEYDQDDGKNTYGINFGNDTS